AASSDRASSTASCAEVNSRSASACSTEPMMSGVAIAAAMMTAAAAPRPTQSPTRDFFLGCPAADCGKVGGV
ncbi:MAG: hypothetical protein WCY76_11260, partial [Leucobacter sp.]